jgi:hypothetical protein
MGMSSLFWGPYGKTVRFFKAFWDENPKKEGKNRITA